MNKSRLFALAASALNASFWNAPAPEPPLSAGVEGAPAVVATSTARGPSRAFPPNASRRARDTGKEPTLEPEWRRARTCDDVRAVIISELTDRAGSLATLRVTDALSWTGRVGDHGHGTRLLRIGSSATTGEPRVWLERRGAICQASLEPPPPARSPSEERAPPPARDWRAMVGPVRIVPVFRDAEITGVRVHGLRSGTLLALLGIQDGDLIESIDGRNLSTPAPLLEAYQRIVTRSALRLAIGVRRRGAVITLHYRFS